MTSEQGLIFGYVLDGQGGGKAVDWPDVQKSDAQDGVLWVHLQRESEQVRSWLETESGLAPVLVGALLSEESRPRCEVHGSGLLLSLRGVNLNPGADPEDMIALVLWIEPHRIISVRRRRVMAVQALVDRIDDGTGPCDAGEFVSALAVGLVERMGPVIADLDDQIDGLEDAVVEGRTESLRRTLNGLRRQAIALRRYIAPQREAMARLMTQQVNWIGTEDKYRLREVADRVTRYVEDLDASRDRAQVVQDELSTRMAEQMNRNMYLLSIVAVVFLPLGLLTGLLGINVGGIPGDKWEWAFTSVSVLLVVLAGFELWLFRRLRWI